MGAFGEYTWADYNDPRGFVIFDTDMRNFEFIKNPYSIFKMISYDDKKDEDIISTIQKTDYSQYKDTYVKILCINRTNPFAFDVMVEKLYKELPVDISIIEDVSTLIDHEEAGDVDQTQHTTSILSSYIKGLTLPVNNDKMISYMRDVYSEAISMEHVE